MKPRLKSATLTPDDVSIWMQLGTDWWQGGAQWMPQAYLNADRRDAELMYRIEMCRKFEREHPADFAQYAGLGWVHCLVAATLGGTRVRFRDSDITYCA